ncbi:MAG: SGNH/GDSL hydrolase family protein [Verrucomicrobiaceae bacterium]
MLRSLILLATLFTTSPLFAKDTPMTPVKDIDSLPRVLLIGDSISIGYTVPVRELLKGKANVHRPLTNCGPTTKGLKELDAWLNTGGKGKKWDLIHFNWGLHDLKYISGKGDKLTAVEAPDSRQQVSPADYEKNLRQLVARLKKTNARLIWRNTTPVPKGAKGRLAGDSQRYNDLAAKVMKEEGIEIHDLFTFAKEHEAKIQQKANVHYTPAGSKQLAAQVVKALKL